jgi:DNA-binding GntR family transcriptional regulator
LQAGFGAFVRLAWAPTGKPQSGHKNNTAVSDQIARQVLFMSIRSSPRSKSKAEYLGEVERVYRLIKSWLVEANLAPGDVLSDVEIATRCHTSRTPVRESFSRLAQDGWLKRIPRKGYLVVPISIREIVELYDYRKVLECFAAERVAQSAGPEVIEELERIVAIENIEGAPLPEVLASNGAFHLRLAELSMNKRIASQVSLVLCYVRRLDTICTETVPGWLGHQEIINELEAHQPERARAAMAKHIDLARDKMLGLFGA